LSQALYPRYRAFFLSAIVLYLAGRSFQVLFFRKHTFQFSFDESIISGFLILTILTSALSILTPINSLVRGLLLALIFSVSFTYRAEIRRDIKHQFSQIKGVSWVYKGFLCIAIIMVALVASWGIWVTDTGIYHAPAVVWIKEYAVVPGLANVQPQLGINSLYFPLSALFSFEKIGSTYINLYPSGGCLFIVFLSRIILEIQSFSEQKNTRVLAPILLLLILCLIVLPKYISSLSPDIICAILTVYACYYFLKAMNNDAKAGIYLFLLLGLLFVYKLSMVTLAIFPLIFLIVKRRFDLLIKALPVIVVLIAIFLIRNYYTSGFLIFPFAELDLFDVDWKYPLEKTFFSHLERHYYLESSHSSYVGQNYSSEFSTRFITYCRTNCLICLLVYSSS